MASFFVCRCGKRLDKNLFSGHAISLVVAESFLDRDFSGLSAEGLVAEIVRASELQVTCEGCRRVYIIEETGPRSVRVYRPDETSKICDECGSWYRADASKMAALCPECAHWIYGYDECEHDMRDGRCTRCDWDGSVSKHVAKLRGDG